MASKEISLWLDERWYHALERHLPEHSLPDKLNELIDDLINELPEHEYEKISREIWEEQRENELLREAQRRFAVFQIDRSGAVEHFQVERPIDFLVVAERLRLHSKSSGKELRDYFNDGITISQEQFHQSVSERLGGSKRVTGAFKIDLDQNILSTLDSSNLWKTYPIKDVCVAAYHATRRKYSSWTEKCAILDERLEGKELTVISEIPEVTGTRELQADEISFSDEVYEHGDGVEFYMPVDFDSKSVFGLDIRGDEFLNLYARYDVEKGTVQDALELLVIHSDGSETEYRYPLSDEEKSIMLTKMDAYYQKVAGESLEEWRSEYLKEQQAPSTPTMGMEM